MAWFNPELALPKEASLVRSENESESGRLLRTLSKHFSKRCDLVVPMETRQARDPVRGGGRGLKSAPRLGHKKSRTGCQQCRTRRVKVQFPFSLPSLLFMNSPFITLRRYVNSASVKAAPKLLAHSAMHS